MSGEGFYPGGTKGLFCAVTNVGRQPVYLSCVGGQYRTKKHFILFIPELQAIKLEPGASFSDTSDYKGKELDTENVAFVCAWDTLNRAHKMRKKNLRKLLNEIRGG